MHVREFVESYFDAWNHSDPEAVAEHLATDGIYRDIPEKVQRSQDELIVSLNDIFANSRHRYELIGDIAASSDTVAFQYRMFPLEKGTTSDRGRGFRGAEFMTLHGDAAISITDYYDIPGVSRSSTVGRQRPRESQKTKYAKSGLNGRQLSEYKNRLETVMQVHQAYLRTDLTLPRLASTIDCSVNHLSQAINSGFDMSFFDYLNQYRVEHAKALLSESENRGDAILNIAFTVGFNSNSAFYAAFKKYVGKTPAQFRRSKLNAHH
jgi:AraC-like DNA-binding protein